MIWVALAIGVAVVVALLLKKKGAAQPVQAQQANAIHFWDSPDPVLEAGIWAANYWNGRSEVCQIGATGSMLPMLKGGEWAVLAHDFEGVGIGSVVAYRTVGGSSPAIGSRLVHRVVAKDGSGWLPRGDTLGCVTEDWNPITRENYIGTLVAVFRQRV